MAAPSLTDRVSALEAEVARLNLGGSKLPEPSLAIQLFWRRCAWAVSGGNPDRRLEGQATREHVSEAVVPADQLKGEEFAWRLNPW
jgi:hypothetical protein